jgi:hypothetical protein
LVYSQFTLGYSALNGNDSCAEFVLTPTSFYAIGGTLVLVNGTILYIDTALTTLVPDGFYSNGTDNWAVVSGNGTLSAQNSCALTTTTTTTTTTAAPTTTSTTTTTTTAAPTTSTTTTTTTNLLSCQDYVTFDVDAAGAINYTDCCGNVVITSYGIGPQVINDCITTNSLGGYYNPPLFPATLSNIAYSGVSCVCATTTTTTSTTTTTTTLPITQNIFITNGSLDVAISQVDFNGITATYAAGQPLPNTTGNGTNLFTTQIGTYTLDVYKNNGVAGQHISVTDSVGGIQCIYFGSGSAVESYTNVVYDGVNPIQIDVQDGTCPTTIPLTWEWTNNNVVETPPFGGGYITISVNSIVVVNQLDSSSTTTTIYNGTISPNVGDVIDIFVYSYANNTYGTQTNLQVFSPLNNTLAAYIDSQPAAGSPSSLTYSFTATSNAINIIASSNSN